MSLFRCEKCGCVENTSLSNYRTRMFDVPEGQPMPPALCSECDPGIAKWHGQWPKRSAIGMKIGLLGGEPYLYTEEQAATIPGLELIGTVISDPEPPADSMHLTPVERDEMLGEIDLAEEDLRRDCEFEGRYKDDLGYLRRARFCVKNGAGEDAIQWLSRSQSAKDGEQVERIAASLPTGTA